MVYVLITAVLSGDDRASKLEFTTSGNDIDVFGVNMVGVVTGRRGLLMAEERDEVVASVGNVLVLNIAQEGVGIAKEDDEV
jgi:hypothetical protein